MNLFSFGRKNRPIGDEVLVVDLGSGSAGAAWVTIAKKESALLYTHREYFAPLSISSYENIAREMNRALSASLHAVLESARKDGRKSLPDSAYCFLSSPWSLSEARTMKYERKSDFKITKDILEDVKVSARVSIEKDLEAGAPIPNQKYEVIFDEFSRTRLNGYLTRTPVGKTARSIELSGFVGLSTKEIQQIISASIQKEFPHLRPIFKPAPFAYYRAVEQIVMVPHDYVFFDIRSEITDVLVVRDEELAYSGSFPFGSMSALRLLSKDVVDAQHRLDLYYSKKLSSEEEVRVRKTLGEIQEEWETYVEDFTHSAALYGALPSTLLYASEVGSELFIKDLVLKKFGLPKNIHKIAVHVFDLPLKEEVEVAPSASFDPFLALSSLYIESQVKL